MAGMMTPQNLVFMDAMRDLAKDKSFLAGKDVRNPFFDEGDFKNTFGKLSTTENTKNIQSNVHTSLKIDDPAVKSALAPKAYSKQISAALEEKDRGNDLYKKSLSQIDGGFRDTKGNIDEKKLFNVFQKKQDGKETMKAAIRHYGLALKHLVAGSGPTSAKASDFEVSGNTSTSEEDEDTREINKVVVTLHLNRALCLLKLHEWNDAIQECDAALDLDPASVKAYYRKISAQVGMMQQELDNEMRGAMWDIEKAWFISEIAVRDIKLAQSQQCMTSQSESNALAMKTVVKKVQRIRKYLKKHRVSFLDRVESAGSTAGGSE